MKPGPGKLLIDSPRMRLEYFPGMVRWKSGTHMKCPATVVVSLNGVGFPDLGYEHVWQAFCYTLGKREDIAELDKLLQLVFDHGDLDEEDQFQLDMLLDALSNWTAYIDEDPFTSQLRLIGLDYDQSSDGNPEHDDGGS